MQKGFLHVSFEVTFRVCVCQHKGSALRDPTFSRLGRGAFHVVTLGALSLHALACAMHVFHDTHSVCQHSFKGGRCL